MPQHAIHAVTAAAALVSLAAFGPVPSSAASLPAQPAGQPAARTGSAAPSRLVPGPCPKPPEPIEALSSARCGFLEVPENRSRPGGRTIELAAAVIPAAEPAASGRRGIRNPTC